jgi:hypothetical protein
VNILADRHHHALYYSLQRLFEDRLGMSLYTPVGHEWWDNHYWRFGAGYGDDRLAQQFLSMDGWTLAPFRDVYWTHDAHHPERVIAGVTLEQARKMRWDFAMATVQDNQRGMSAFARDTGAQYLLHAGNTHQQIDWGLNPLVISTNESVIEGRGVRVHQEISRAFAYRKPYGTKVIRSFVNCFASTPCIEDFERVRDALPEYAFAVHGIDGAQGNVATVNEIAELMAGSAFGWHDKHQGDGFGHVIHDWAAIGRPIIGHASHYRGLMAERFWQDGVTAIDLDRHSWNEVAEIIRSMTPEKHREMCEAIRAEFDKIDWDLEAAAVAELLGIRAAVAA